MRGAPNPEPGIQSCTPQLGLWCCTLHPSLPEIKFSAYLCSSSPNGGQENPFLKLPSP